MTHTHIDRAARVVLRKTGTENQLQSTWTDWVVLEAVQQRVHIGRKKGRCWGTAMSKQRSVAS